MDQELVNKMYTEFLEIMNKAKLKKGVTQEELSNFQLKFYNTYAEHLEELKAFHLALTKESLRCYNTYAHGVHSFKCSDINCEDCIAKNLPVEHALRTINKPFKV